FLTVLLLYPSKVLYVGKNSARSYIERIPAHFDVRFAAWMNSFFMDYIKAKNINITPNLIRNMYNSSEVQNQIKNDVMHIHNNYYISFIYMQGFSLFQKDYKDKRSQAIQGKINRLEQFFLAEYIQPKLNGRRSDKRGTYNKKLDQIIVKKAEKEKRKIELDDITLDDFEKYKP
ncbi:hypothetical protein HMPREF9554_00093, partial [Treponema phagedenis F0421]|uniref:hypothetical protein n=2 Tax=Treponema phagedenis TaxID=162 RepID=UPI0001F6405E